MRGLVQLQNTLSDDPREPQPEGRDRGDPADDARLADRPRQGGGRDPRGELRRPGLQVADPKAIKFAEAPVRGTSVLKYEPGGQGGQLLPQPRQGGPRPMAKEARQHARGPPRRPLPLHRRGLEDSSNEIEVTANGNGGIAVAEPEPQVVDVEPKVAETDIADAEVEVVEAPKPKRKPAKKTKTSAKPKQKPKAKTKPKRRARARARAASRCSMPRPKTPRSQSPRRSRPSSSAEVEETVAPEHPRACSNLMAPSPRRRPGLRPRRARHRPLRHRPPQPQGACCAWSASAAPASTPSIAWSRPRSQGVEFIAINTDLQSLQNSSADIKLAHRRRDDPRPRLGLGPAGRLSRRLRGAGQDQGACSRAPTWSSSPPEPAAAPAPAPHPWSPSSPATSAR